MGKHKKDKCNKEKKCHKENSYENSMKMVTTLLNFLKEDENHILPIQQPTPEHFFVSERRVKRHVKHAKSSTPSAPAKPSSSATEDLGPIESADATRVLGLLKPTFEGYSKQGIKKAEELGMVKLPYKEKRGDIVSVSNDHLLPIITSSIVGLNEDISDLHKRIIQEHEESTLYPAIPK